MHSFLIVSSNADSRWQHAVNQISKALSTTTQKVATHPDFLELTSEGSISIKHIRELKVWVHKKPFKAPKKAVLIPEAQNLTLPAQHALLKTLEEPPGDTIIILTAPNPSLLLPTVVSRCQIIKLRSPKSLEKGDFGPEVPALLTKLPAMSPGQRLAIVGDYAGSRDQAIQFCETLLALLRQNLRKNQLTNPSSLRQTSRALTRLRANVNPKLTLENLFLNL